MRLDVYVHLVDSGSADRKLDRILALLEKQIMIDATTQKSLDDLNAAVAAETQVETSVETLLTGLSDQIAALKTGVTDPAVLAAIDSATAIVTADTARAAAAVAANTLNQAQPPV
jgi:hypothetical protein